MQYERLASFGTPRPRLLVASALLIGASVGVASLRDVVAPKPLSMAPAVARPHAVPQPPGDIQPHGDSQPRPVAQSRASTAGQELSRVPAPTNPQPVAQAGIDNAPKTEANLEIRLIADSPTLPQVIEPPAAPAPEARPSPALPVDSVWRALAMCESGGNWQSDDGDGYFGGLQFDLPSWQEVGGNGVPSEHPQDVQVEMAERLQARRGWTAWPVCARVLGLI